MNTRTIRALALIVSAASVMIPALAAAQTGYGSVGVNVGTAVHTNVAASSSVGATTQGNIDASAGSNDSTGVVVPISASVDLGGTAHAKSVMQADSNITAVNSTSDSVQVSYREPAKLFGFIKVSVPATAEAKADGTVSIHYPWYAFLMTKDSASLQTEVRSHVGTVDSSGSFSADAQTRLIDALSAGLKSYASSQMSAQASSNTQVNTAY